MSHYWGKMVFWIQLFWIFACLTLVPAAQAQEGVNPFGGAGGELIFFPEQEKRPAENRFPVKAGEEISYCLRVDFSKAPILERLKAEATQVRMVLENQKDPPDLLLVDLGNGKKPIQLGESGCYEGSFQIPAAVGPGRYQIADFLVKTRRSNLVSLRQLLFQFTRADELQVSNDDFDDVAPRLVAIETLEDEVQKLNNSGDFIRLLIHQTFRFRDEKGEVDPETLRVYYALLEDGQQVSVHQANCHKEPRTKTDFVCALKLLRPYWRWELRNLQLALESIYVQDKSGNGLVIQNPKDFKKIAGSTPIRFQFKPDVPGIGSQQQYQRHPSLN